MIVEPAKHSMNKEKMWISYHELTASKLFVTEWEVFLVKCSEKVPPLLYQHITDELFEDVIRKMFEMSTKHRLFKGAKCPGIGNLEISHLRLHPGNFHGFANLIYFSF